MGQAGGEQVGVFVVVEVLKEEPQVGTGEHLWGDAGCTECLDRRQYSGMVKQHQHSSSSINTMKGPNVQVEHEMSEALVEVVEPECMRSH